MVGILENRGRQPVDESGLNFVVRREPETFWKSWWKAMEKSGASVIIPTFVVCQVDQTDT
jgi:hypothetical protein